MGKTAHLRRLVREQLQTVPGETYHKSAPPSAAYPYKTFRLKSISFEENRNDYDLCVDIWHRGDPKIAEDIADQIEKLFQSTNLPQDYILPTFFRDSRHDLEDPDKTLHHIQLRFLVQLYEMEE